MRISDWSSDVCSSDLCDELSEGGGDEEATVGIGETATERLGILVRHLRLEPPDAIAAGGVEGADLEIDIHRVDPAVGGDGTGQQPSVLRSARSAIGLPDTADAGRYLEMMHGVAIGGEHV